MVSSETPATLSASEMVYLQGEKFSPKAGVFNKIKLLHVDQDVNVNELVMNLLAAAFLWAEESGAVRLEIRQKKVLLGLAKSTTLFVDPVRPVDFPMDSFESAIYPLAGQFAAKNQNEVSNVIYAWMGADSSSPWSEVVKKVQWGLARRGLLEVIEEKKLKIFTVSHFEIPLATVQLANTLRPDGIQAMFLRCQQTRPDLWKLLNKQIKSGVDSRQEQSRSDD